MKFTYDKIKEEVESHGWKIISKFYKNLDTELEFECPNGHHIFRPYKKLRNSFTCPICEINNSKRNSLLMVPPRKGYRILCLDQATYTAGWSIFDDKELIRFGKVSFKETDQTELRINQVKHWLINMIKNVNPDLIVLEDIQLQTTYNNKNAVGTYRVLAELLGVLINTCIELNIRYEIVHSKTWKSFCRVNGKTRTDQKRSAQLIILNKYNINVTQDEADALCIGIYASNTFKKNGAWAF